MNAIAATLALIAAVTLAVVAANGNLRIARDWPVFLLLLLSYPFAFLVSRGNVEYWVWLLVAVGLWSESSGRSPLLTGGAFGLGSLLKLYPLLFVVPLIALRRRGTAAITLGVAIAGLALPAATTIRRTHPPLCPPRSQVGSNSVVAAARFVSPRLYSPAG